MLTGVVTLEPGEWVLQNAAHSSVGRMVIGLAKARGLKTVNIARRQAFFSDLKALGVDAGVVDGGDLAERVSQATSGAKIRLELDAVAGSATGRVGECLIDTGTVCVYGSVSGDDPRIERTALIYCGITLTGFMLGRALARRTLDQVRGIYAELGALIRDRKLLSPVERVYPIEEIKVALAHAEQGERSGKILVTPN